jgi:hypothetical protein
MITAIGEPAHESPLRVQQGNHGKRQSDAEHDLADDERVSRGGSRADDDEGTCRWLRPTGAFFEVVYRHPFAAVFASASSTPEAQALAKL